MASPMEQFAIKVYKPITAGGYDVSFTNSSLWMLIALAAVSIFLFVGTARPQLVPGRWQAAVEYVYDFVRKMLDENVGPEGRAFAPLIFSIFIFVLACNLLGLIPFVGAFTPTSHVAVTLGPRRAGVRDRLHRRLLEARTAFLQPVLAQGHVFPACRFRRADRVPLLPQPPVHARHSIVREHDCGACAAEGVRHLRGRARLVRRAALCVRYPAARGQRRARRARSADRGSAGLWSSRCSRRSISTTPSISINRINGKE